MINLEYVFEKYKDQEFISTDEEFEEIGSAIDEFLDYCHENRGKKWSSNTDRIRVFTRLELLIDLVETYESEKELIIENNPFLCR